MIPKLLNPLIILVLNTVVMSHEMGKRHVDFRDRFLQRKRDREIKDERLKILDKYSVRSTETLNDIVHYINIPGGRDPTSKKIREMENDFRRILAMEGMKYIYKRDLHWRTWRKVLLDTEGNEKLFCYKCNNLIQNDVKGHCGTWIIEEGPPPCPYEFFSVIDDHKLCGANYTQYNNVNDTCPSVISFTDLTATCDNPIETIWKISKLYGKAEGNESLICAGKDYCEIFTYYEVTPQKVIFRIINTTNDVIFSRIMKPNNTNYICVEDCGRFNPDTGKVTKYDIPLKLDLLSQGINKRDNMEKLSLYQSTPSPPFYTVKRTTVSLVKRTTVSSVKRTTMSAVQKVNVTNLKTAKEHRSKKQKLRKFKKIKMSMSKKGGRRFYRNKTLRSGMKKEHIVKSLHEKKPREPIVLSLGSIL